MVGADDVGLNEFARVVDRAIHMALVAKLITVRGRCLASKHSTKARSLISPFTKMWHGSPCTLASIGEFVEVDHRLVAAGNPVEHKITADENCPGCDKNHFSCLSIVAIDKYR